MKKTILFSVILLTIATFIGCKKNETTSNNSTTGTATLTSINCDSIVIPFTLTKGVATANRQIFISYTGGNGGNFSNLSVTSTGVSGLTASLNSGNLKNGNGELDFIISGTPKTSGIASFNFSIGGKSCTFRIIVNEVTNQQPADYFVKTYTVLETVKVSGNIQTNSFTATMTKVDSNSIIFNDLRNSLPIYSLNNYTFPIINGKMELGTVEGIRYGMDSVVITYLYGSGATIYNVKLLCK